MPEFTCQLQQAGAPLPHIWEHTVGSGHARLGLRADWQTQLARCHRELGVQHVRFHGLLSDGMGTLTMQQEKLVYSFFNADQIMDFLISIGMRPFVELSFMPTTLASGSDIVFFYKGNVTPPKDYKQWATLIRKLVGHWVERYGVAEVRQWFFEVWNEPNLHAFWTGTQADYFTLYRYTVNAIKEIDSDLRVGGPATANNSWIADFVNFCETEELPADFISTHQYPTDAFGKPGDDTEAQLAASKRGIMRQRAMDTRRQAGNRPLYYTEWNTSSNPFFHRHDEPFAAAFALKSWLDVTDVVQGYSYWTFSDIFEENYFSSVPFHGGFGLLTIYGIAKPTYRAAELLHRAGHEALMVDGLHNTVNCWVNRAGPTVQVLLTNHALPRHPIEAEQVCVKLAGAAAPQKAAIERIDENHANPRRLWEEWGKPDYLRPQQVEQLQATSQLVAEPLAWRATEDAITCELNLPPHAVAALTFEFSQQA